MDNNQQHNTNKDQELLEVSLEKIMGAHGKDPQFPEKVAQLSFLIWSEFVDQELMDLLSDDNKALLLNMLSDETTTQEEFREFLTQGVPDFDERYQKRILKNKAITVTGRIELLRATVDPEEKELFAILDRCDELAQQQEWLKLQDVLVEHFSEY